MLAVIRLYESDYEIAKGVKDKWDKPDPGDGVLFERGSVFRGPDRIDREGAFLECQPGVT